MASVISRWSATPPALSGSFSPGEWQNAGVLPMPGGFILVKNDSNFLYLAIDLINDTGNSAGVGDYFWLTFDKFLRILYISVRVLTLKSKSNKLLSL